MHKSSWTIGAAAIAAILGFNALLLAVMEYGLRSFSAFPPTTAATYEADPKTLYAHVAESVGWEISPVHEYPPVKLVYNNAGFRGAALSREKPSGEVRIFTLGDSIVEGRQVDEQATLSKQLEQLLHNDGIKARVVNAGVSAYTTTTMNLMLRNRVANFSPDMVIAFLFANDYSDNFNYGNYSAHPELLSGVVPVDLIPKGLGLAKPTTLAEWLMQNSAIYAALSSLKPAIVSMDPDPMMSVPDDFLHTARAISKKELSDAEQRLVEFTHAGLRAMADFCRDRKIAFIAAIVPWPPQVSKDEWKTGKRRFGYAPDDAEQSELYQKRLLDYAASHDIAMVDLLPAFRAQSARTPSAHLFFPYDGHMSELGHTTAAQGVLPEVKKALSPGE